MNINSSLSGFLEYGNGKFVSHKPLDKKAFQAKRKRDRISRWQKQYNRR